MKMLPAILIIAVISILLVGSFFMYSQNNDFSFSQLNPSTLLGKLADAIGIGPGDSDSKIEFNIKKGGDEELLDIWTDKYNKTQMIVYIDFAHIPGQSYAETKAEYHRRVKEAGRNIAYVPIVKTKKPEKFDVSKNYINLTNANSFNVTYDKLRAGYEIRIGWGSVVAESSASSLATEPSMIDKFCSDSKGYYHIAYIDNDGAVKYANSTDEGQTWNNVTAVSPGFSGDWKQAGLLCNSTDTVFVTYLGDGAGMGFDEAYMRDSSDNFGTETAIMSFQSPGTVDTYSCAINKDSSVHCCGISDPSDTLYYTNSTDFTNLHGPFTSSSDDSDMCDIELSKDNNEVFIVASGTDQDDVDIFSARDNFVRHQIYDGTSMPNIGREPNIAITPDNKIWITFVDASDLWVANGTNNSLTSWTNKEIDTQSSFYPEIAINDKENIVITYQTKVTKCAGTLKYAISRDGINWTNRTQLSDRDNSCYVGLPYSQYPTSNRIYNTLPYIYTSNSTGTYIVYYDNVTLDKPPTLDIVFPTNNTLTSNSGIDVNYTTTDDVGIDSCWYSNDTYSVNTTLANCNNLTTITWVDGEHNVRVYVNDTLGTEAQDSVTFTIDTTNPDIEIVSPVNNTKSNDNGLDVEYTISDSNLNNCWYSNDTYSVNTTITCGTNITTITWSEGSHDVTIWANDSVDNGNHSSVSFTIDTLPPSFDNLPTNQTIYDNESLSYDVDATDTGLGLETFAINWTGTFIINSITGVLTNNSGLGVANYSINVSVNDTLGNLNSSIFNLEVQNSIPTDTTPPTFDNLQNHTQLANLSFAFDLDATDPQGVDTFVLNQTNYFDINSTGTITNNTALSQDKIHWLKVIVNDTLGNARTGEFYINITPEIPPEIPPAIASKVFKIYPEIEKEIPHIKLGKELVFA